MAHEETGVTYDDALFNMPLSLMIWLIVSKRQLDGRLKKREYSDRQRKAILDEMEKWQDKN